MGLPDNHPALRRLRSLYLQRKDGHHKVSVSDRFWGHRHQGKQHPHFKWVKEKFRHDFRELQCLSPRVFIKHFDHAAEHGRTMTIRKLPRFTGENACLADGVDKLLWLSPHPRCSCFDKRLDELSAEEPLAINPDFRPQRSPPKKWSYSPKRSYSMPADSLIKCLIRIFLCWVSA